MKWQMQKLFSIKKHDKKILLLSKIENKETQVARKSVKVIALVFL